MSMTGGNTINVMLLMRGIILHYWEHMAVAMTDNTPLALFLGTQSDS